MSINTALTSIFLGLKSIKHKIDGHILVNDGQKHTIDGHILTIEAKKLVLNA